MAQARSEETRAKVIDAARELIVEQGHEQVAMKDLVARSGVSNGSIFHHFGSKDGVLETIFVEERRAYLGHVAEAILGFEGDPCDALGAGSAAAIAFQARAPDRHFRLISQFSHSDWLSRNSAMWANLAAEIEGPVIAWAMPHMAQGRLPMLAPAAIQSMMLGPAELLFHQWRGKRIPGELTDFGPLLALFVGQGLKALREETANTPS